MFAKKSVFRFFILLFAILLISGTASASPLKAPLGTSFTYQGRLLDGGVPANGAYDLEFTLFDALTGGSQVGSTLTQGSVTVTNGLFTVQLDFGAVFNGTALYLEIGVRPGGSSGAYTTLTPRQLLSPTPDALYTTQAGNAALLNNQPASYYQNASNINSGTLGVSYFDAYAALSAEGYLNNAANALALNNGTLQATLNADLLDGLHAASFALAGHNHWGQTWTGSGTGLTLSGGTIGLSGSGSNAGVVGISGTTGVAGIGNTYGVEGGSTSGTGVYGNSSNSNGVWGASTNGTGVYGSGSTGVSGTTTNSSGYGVSGTNTSGSGVGVYGSGGNYGISGNGGSSGTGIYGTTTNGSGYGVSGNNTSSFGIGVYGSGYYGVEGSGTVGVHGYGSPAVEGYAAGTNGVGVYAYGYDFNGGGIGVNAQGHTAIQASGIAIGSIGVIGSGLAYGVEGQSSNPNGYGIYGRAYNDSGNYAGYFDGNVQINGNYAVTGTKSAVVNTQDYGTRTLYTVESPENWFQDFGTGQLTNGSAVITIDPVFAETVNLADDYHVFFTPMGDCALYVSGKTPTSFTVQALGGQTCSIAFDYNIVAKRLGYEDLRLAVADPSPTAGAPNK